MKSPSHLTHAHLLRWMLRIFQRTEKSFVRKKRFDPSQKKITSEPLFFGTEKLSVLIFPANEIKRLMLTFCNYCWDFFKELGRVGFRKKRNTFRGKEQKIAVEPLCFGTGLIFPASKICPSPGPTPVVGFALFGDCGERRDDDPAGVDAVGPIASFASEWAPVRKISQ